MTITAVSRSLLRWVDSWAADTDIPSDELGKVEWLRVVPFAFMHLACLAVFWVGWSWTAVGAASLLYFLRMFAITGFYHRYFSHKTFTTGRWTQFVFAVLGGTAAQRGPLWWAAHHRHHHRFSDKEDDVHSPSQHGLYWSHMGWITSKGNFRTRLENVPDLAQFSELRFLDRFDILIPLILAFFLFALGSILERTLPGLGTNGPQLLVWGFFLSTVILFHGTCTINSLAHTIGSQRYETRDQSRNSFFLALITLGEGWHNNHHHFPASTRQGFYWWEIDITYYLLRLLGSLGLIWDMKGVPETVRSAKRL